MERTIVEMYIGRPVIHGRQVLRPFEYHVEESHIDELRSPDVVISEGLRTLDGTDFSGLVVPSITSKDIRTSTYSDLYRFTMVVRNPRIVAGQRTMGQRASIQTYVGYFLDEPCIIQGEEIIHVNDNAGMLITNSSDMINMSGNQLTLNRNVDVAHGLLAEEANQTLYRLDVAELAPGVYQNSKDSEEFGSHVAHMPLNGSQERGVISSVERTSPVTQIGLLARGISSCESFEDMRRISTGAGISGFQHSKPSVPYRDAVLKRFASRTTDTGASLRTTGIDAATQTLAFSDIYRAYGEDNVKLIYVPELARSWDVLDPSMGTVESQASVVATSMLRELCGKYRLSKLGFIYASDKRLLGTQPTRSFTVGDISNNSYFAFTDIDPWADVENTMDNLRMIQGSIHLELDIGLTPILHSLSNYTDFVINVRNTIGDRCLVNVQFADGEYDMGGRHDICYFEQHNRLAGLTSPIVGDHAAMRTNSQVVDGVMRHMVASMENVAQDHARYRSIDPYGSEDLPERAFESHQMPDESGFELMADDIRFDDID